VRAVILLLIRLYQWTLSPWLGGSCRFYPSCSEYAYRAVSEYGAIKGGWMGIRRVLRCNPFCEGGYDPVPASAGKRSE
jgi:putative membrane protein insertion efficiency factor